MYGAGILHVGWGWEWCYFACVFDRHCARMRILRDQKFLKFRISRCALCWDAACRKWMGVLQFGVHLYLLCVRESYEFQKFSCILFSHTRRALQSDYVCRKPLYHTATHRNIPHLLCVCESYEFQKFWKPQFRGMVAVTYLGLRKCVYVCACVYVCVCGGGSMSVCACVCVCVCAYRCANLSMRCGCWEKELPCTATHRNTMQHTATHCCTLHHTTSHCSTQHIAVHCSTLQHTAAHCSLLQHTAAHCSTL